MTKLGKKASKILKPRRLMYREYDIAKLRSQIGDYEVFSKKILKAAESGQTQVILFQSEEMEEEECDKMKRALEWLKIEFKENYDITLDMAIYYNGDYLDDEDHYYQIIAKLD
jgi:hypothetical protein